MKLANSPTAKNERRKGALHRLTCQEGPLTEDQQKRIMKEIVILEDKIVPVDVARASRSKKFRGTR